MLSKFELEHDVSNYIQLQQALTQCTMAKNSCSLRHGYAPDTLVFGKGLKIPASITSGDTLPAHATADSEDLAGIKFRALLAMRETARRAFHAADNDMSLRRAALRRSRPHRGSYEAGEWVMIWKVHNLKGSWVGPARVIKQDDASTVFCNNAGSIIRAAPEHIRPVSAVEARLIPITMPKIPNVEEQSQTPSGNTSSTQEIPNVKYFHTPSPKQYNPVTMPESQINQPSSHSASEQPDQEPEEMPITPSNSPEMNPPSIIQN